MLILTRKVDQSLIITPGPDLDPAIAIGELFQGGPIELGVQAVTGGRVQLNVIADRRFLVLRKELYEQGR